MFYAIYQFIKHYASATFIDVLHSPFVFELYNQCVKRAEINDSNITRISILKNKLVLDQRVIEQEDWGAKGNGKKRNRTLSSIASRDSKSTRIAQIIYRLVKYFKPKYCIELGTSLGFTTGYIAAGLETDGVVISIEGSPLIATQAQVNLNTLGLLSKVKLEIGQFDEKLPEVLHTLPKLDFAFIDGNHTYEATLRYFELLKPHVHNDSVIVFDDIYWSKEMTKAWIHIQKDPMVSVTVDLYAVGLVFFRKEQRKQDFRLRVW